MSWNPFQVIGRLWPMKRARPLLFLEAVLWILLITGGMVFTTSAIIHTQDTSFSIPYLSVVTGWQYFGLLVLALIIITVPLSIALGFWASTRPEPMGITDNKPGVYRVTSENGQPNIHINASNNSGIEHQKHLHIALERLSFPSISIRKAGSSTTITNAPPIINSSREVIGAWLNNTDIDKVELNTVMLVLGHLKDDEKFAHLYNIYRSS